MKDDKKVVKGEATDRRALLKGLVAGSAVVTGSKAIPENWVKPLADSVVLPSHATTTNGDYGGGDGYTDEDDGEDNGDGVYTDGGDDDYGTDGDTDYEGGDYENYSGGDIGDDYATDSSDYVGQ